MPAPRTTPDGGNPRDEHTVLRTRQAGSLSVEESFRELYDLYGREVLAWLLVRARQEAEDIFQDVWSAFYFRWCTWEVREDLLVPGARPVLSFLFRTAAFTWRSRGRQHVAKRVQELAIPDVTSAPDLVHRRLELGHCLTVAAEICPPEEMDVLLARLSGFSGAETAQALGITAAIADHRYRDCVSRLRRRLQPKEVNS